MAEKEEEKDLVRWQHGETGRIVNVPYGFYPGTGWFACGGTVSKDELNGWFNQANKQIPIIKYNQYKGVTISKSNLPDFSISMGKYNFEGEILYKPLKDLLFSIFMFFWKRSYRNKEALHGSLSFTEDK